MCKAWSRTCYKCQKQNHFANVCKANIQQTHLVEKLNKGVQTENALLHVAINLREQSTLSISFEGVQTENTLLHVAINLKQQSTLSISFEGVQTAY